MSVKFLNDMAYMVQHNTIQYRVAKPAVPETFPLKILIAKSADQSLWDYPFKRYLKQQCMHDSRPASSVTTLFSVRVHCLILYTTYKCIKVSLILSLNSLKFFFTEIGNCTQSNSVCKNLVNADNFIIQ